MNIENVNIGILPRPVLRPGHRKFDGWSRAVEGTLSTIALAAVPGVHRASRLTRRFIALTAVALGS